jgi:hypothetical protein
MRIEDISDIVNLIGVAIRLSEIPASPYVSTLLDEEEGEKACCWASVCVQPCSVQSHHRPCVRQGTDIEKVAEKLFTEKHSP